MMIQEQKIQHIKILYSSACYVVSLLSLEVFNVTIVLFDWQNVSQKYWYWILQDLYFAINVVLFSYSMFAPKVLFETINAEHGQTSMIDSNQVTYTE